MKSQRSKKSIHKAVAQATKSFDLYSDNPRMVPRHIVPSVLKMEMTVGKFIGQRYGRNFFFMDLFLTVCQGLGYVYRSVA